MSIFGKIMSAIFGSGSSSAAGTGSAAAPAGADARSIPCPRPGLPAGSRYRARGRCARPLGRVLGAAERYLGERWV